MYIDEAFILRSAIALSLFPNAHCSVFVILIKGELFGMPTHSNMPAANDRLAVKNRVLRRLEQE